MKTYFILILFPLFLLRAAASEGAPYIDASGALIFPTRSQWYAVNPPQWSEITNKADVVTTDAAQTVTGTKTFSGATIFSGPMTFSGTLGTGLTFPFPSEPTITSTNAVNVLDVSYPGYPYGIGRHSGTLDLIAGGTLSAYVGTTTGSLGTRAYSITSSGITLLLPTTVSGVLNATTISSPNFGAVHIVGPNQFQFDVNGNLVFFGNFNQTNSNVFGFSRSGNVILSLDYATMNVKLTSGLDFVAGSEKLDVRSGNISVGTVGYGLKIKEGSNAKQGVATLSAGVVMVSNTSVTANSRIFVTAQTDSTNAGNLWISARTAGTSFAIKSSNASDNRMVAYEIFEPAP